MYYSTNSNRRAFKVESKIVIWDGQRFGYGLSTGWFYDFSGAMSGRSSPSYFYPFWMILGLLLQRHVFVKQVYPRTEMLTLPLF